MNKNVAMKIVTAIAQAAQAVKGSPLKKILLFGSTVRGVPEADLDLILEVDLETFEEYSGFCVAVLDGIRPFSDDPLVRFYGHSWDYFSPKEARSKAALNAIGVSVEHLNLDELEEYLDVICLPEGWDDKTSAVYANLKPFVADSRDPDFLEKAAASKMQLFPQVQASAEEVEVKKPASNQIFIAARHGSYDHSENLSEGGKKQMQRLAEAVKEVINGSDLKVSLLCSTAPRAEQGGKILIEALGIPEDRAAFHRCLWDDSEHPGDYQRARQLVEESLQDDTLVLLLSHLDMVPDVVRFVRDKLGTKGDIGSVYYGEGLMVTAEGVSAFPKK